MQPDSRRNSVTAILFSLLILFLLPTLGFAFGFLSGNPTEMSRAESVTIAVEGSCEEQDPRYTWAVEANGMTFSSSQTSIPFNTLKADDYACGTAKIKVADKCGNEITTEIRNTTGGYHVLLESCGVLDGWHQSVCIQDGFEYTVDHFNCSNPDTDSGDKCPSHPCCECSSYYCAEGSEKRAWGCRGEASNNTPADTDRGEAPATQLCPLPRPQNVSNPVSVYNGNNFEQVEDIRFPSPFRKRFYFKRYYNSQSENTGPLGYGWSHNFSATLTPPCLVIDKQCYLRIEDETGRGVYFKEGVENIWEGAFGDDSQVVASTGGYTWQRLNGMHYFFTLQGQLESVADEAGNLISLTYDANDRLQTISDSASGRSMTLHYNVDGRIDYISGPVTAAVTDGTWVTYAYDGSGNLTSAAYADGSGFDYAYTDSLDVHNLTAKKDKMGHLLTSWTYDALDRVRDSFTRDGKGVTIDYNSDKMVTVTDAYGVERVYRIALFDGIKRIVGIKQSDGCMTCGEEPVRIEYDKKARVIEAEYANEMVKQYADYNDRGYSRTVKTAAGTDNERTVYYTYHPTINIRLSRTEKSLLGDGDKVTIWDYDDDGNSVPNENPGYLLSRMIERGFTKNELGAVAFEKITTFTYNSRGQVLSIDGPKLGNQDMITFTYDPLNGDLWSITRPHVGTTTFSEYTASGHPGRITDPNGNAQVFMFDGRDRITTITQLSDNSVTTYEYNTAGEFSRIVAANGVTADFDYDPTYGRLNKITDPDGNYIQYNYDSQGNPTEQAYYNAAGTRLYWKRFDYQSPDRPGKLWKVINPDNTFAQYQYDAVGNISSITDAAGKTTAFEYNPFRRLSAITQPGSMTTSFIYDLQGNPASVTNAENQRTAYVYDDAGRVLSRSSPDTETTTFDYDLSNNLSFKKEANGSTFSYTYDDVNRLTGILVPDPAEEVTFTYDEQANGKGRLTGITDTSGVYAYRYDAKGNLIEMQVSIGAATYTTTYSYDPAGTLTGITYPDGRIVTFELDNSGKVNRVRTTKGGNSAVLAENISYMPFGSVNSMSLGNGLLVTRNYDDQYRLESITAGNVLNYSYTFDAVELYLKVVFKGKGGVSTGRLLAAVNRPH